MQLGFNKYVLKDDLASILVNYAHLWVQFSVPEMNCMWRWFSGRRIPHGIYGFFTPTICNLFCSLLNQGIIKLTGVYIQITKYEL